MSMVLDLIVVLIILAVALISAKRGFVKVAIELAGFIAAVFITLTISTPLGNITYDKIIEPQIVKSMSAVTDKSVTDTSDAVWNALPSVIKNHSEKLGVSKDSLDKTVSEHIGDNTENAVRAVSQTAVKPMAVKLISLIYSVFLMIILIFIVKILAKFINRLFSFSIVGSLNRVLGGIVGIPKGIIIAALFCTVVSLIVSVTENGFLILTGEAVRGSWFFTHLTAKFF